MMKSLRLVAMAMMAVMMCMNFASCSSEDVLVSEDPKEPKYVTVGLGCTGEFLEFSESQMGRAATDELYGIQVYALTENGTDSYGNPTYQSTYYAYGMFTSLDDVKIKLLEDQKYRFEVSIVIDPFKNGSDVWFNKHYSSYFNENGTEFVYSSTDNHFYPSYVSGFQYNYDRYYGELDVYTPKQNESVEIHTKRVAYGVKYEATGLGDGDTFLVEVKRAGDLYKLYDIEFGAENYEGIYTFYSIYGAWRGREISGSYDSTTGEYEYENYYSDKHLTISWKKADGTVVPMGTYTVTFKRNVKTTIRIKAENLDLDNGILVYKEEVSMADDDVIYDISGGTVVEKDVTSGN
jgi:hypothetical protein